MVPTESPESFDRARVIVPALAISAIGALFYNLLPLYLGTAQDDRGLGNQEIGFLTAAFFLGYKPGNHLGIFLDPALELAPGDGRVDSYCAAWARSRCVL
jgi:hypothetical protein